MAVVDLLKNFLGKLDEITIKTEEELLFLDKIIFKSCNLSKDFKMRLLSPIYQEKFQQRMKDIKLDHSNFLNMLKVYEKGKGPYNKSKDIPLTLPPALENAVPKPKPAQDVPQPYKPDAVPEKMVRRPVEKGGMTPKRAARSSSSSSSSSDSDENQGLHVKISKLQEEIARLTAEKGLGEPDPVRPSPKSKYSFNLKKPEGPGRTVLPHTKDDQYFERTSRAPEQLREPRSERGEREYRIEPDTYHSPPRGEGRSKWEASSGKKAYRNKTYRPPYPFKR